MVASPAKPNRPGRSTKKGGIIMQCVKCGGPVTNETAQSAAPACDECRAFWRKQQIDQAIRTLKSAGYEVIAPGPERRQA